MVTGGKLFVCSLIIFISVWENIYKQYIKMNAIEIPS